MDNPDIGHNLCGLSSEDTVTVTPNRLRRLDALGEPDFKPSPVRQSIRAARLACPPKST